MKLTIIFDLVNPKYRSKVNASFLFLFKPEKISWKIHSKRPIDVSSS